MLELIAKVIQYLFFFALVIMMMLASCFNIPMENTNGTIPISTVSNALNFDVSIGTVTYNRDTHGGFHGDGMTIVTATFPEDATLAQIEEAWTPLPLTENLSTAVYGKHEENYSRNAFFTDESGEPVLPQIENGYYFFRDRASESTNPSDDSGLYSRASYNFTLAIYDTDTHTLYYLELDT